MRRLGICYLFLPLFFFVVVVTSMNTQANVLASAQRRKMKGYGDFKRITAVIIPEDATYKERCEKQTEKTVSDNALNEMKGKFDTSI